MILKFLYFLLVVQARVTAFGRHNLGLCKWLDVTLEALKQSKEPKPSILAPIQAFWPRYRHFGPDTGKDLISV